MAIKLEDKANVVAPSGTYPFGAIKDDPGNGTGTPVNVQVYGDFHQFFAKMLDESGITINDLPDNATNGFQYFEALMAQNFLNAKTAWANITLSLANFDFASGNLDSASGTARYKVIGKTLFVTGECTFATGGTVSTPSTPIVMDLILPGGVIIPTTSIGVGNSARTVPVSTGEYQGLNFKGNGASALNIRRFLNTNWDTSETYYTEFSFALELA